MKIHYDKEGMSLSFHIGKFYKYLQCPFATWWKARKYFKKPKFKFYFGPMQKKYWFKGNNEWKMEPKWLWEDKGFFYFVSYDYIKWKTSKWFPVLLESQDISWKDKYNSPRYEHPGFFSIIIGRNVKTAWQFAIIVTAPEFFWRNDCTKVESEDNYWESMLWYLHYVSEYNSLNHKRNLFKVREILKDYWTSSEAIYLNDSEIISIGEETLNLGCDNIKEFSFIDIKSKKLKDILYRTDGYSKLKSDINIYISVTGCEKKSLDSEHKIGTNVSCNTQYVKYMDNFIRLYYYDNHLRDVLKGNYTITFKYMKQIELGPTFKDEYLTKKGIKFIRNASRTRISN